MAAAWGAQRGMAAALAPSNPKSPPGTPTLLDGGLACQQRRVVVAGAAVVAACRRRRLGGRWRCCGCRRLLLPLLLRLGLLLLHPRGRLRRWGCRVHGGGAPLLELRQRHIVGRLRHAGADGARWTLPVLCSSSGGASVSGPAGRMCGSDHACRCCSSVRWGAGRLQSPPVLPAALASTWARGPPSPALSLRQQRFNKSRHRHAHLATRSRHPRPVTATMASRALAWLLCLFLAASALCIHASELPAVRLRTRTLRTRQVRLAAAAAAAPACCHAMP